MSKVKEYKEKTRIVRCKQRNGDIYVLERITKYNPKTKRNDIISSTLKGKIVKGTTEMVPTRAKSPKGVHKPKSKPIVQTPVSASRTRTGMMDIIDYIGRASGVDDILYRITDTATAQKIISLARYLLATNGQTLPGIEVWQYSHPLPYSQGISQNVYHNLMRDIGRDESIQQSFFSCRADMLEDGEAIAFDSTTISTYSENQPEARYGFNKAGDGLKTIKLLTLYSTEQRLPIAFTKLSGNLPDVTTQSNAIKQLEALGVNAIGLVTDNGYYSQQNMAELLMSGFHFITLAKVSLEWVAKELEAHRNDFNSMSSACTFDPQTHCVTVLVTREFSKQRKYANHKLGLEQGAEEKFSRRIYLHLYFNNMRAAQERSVFERELMELKQQIERGKLTLDCLSEEAMHKVDKYLIVKPGRGSDSLPKVTFNEEACREYGKNHGYFALVSDKEKNAEEALRKYRKRETIEEFFRGAKQSADMNRIRVWDPDTLRGRLFVQFVALCYREYFNEKIKQIKEELGNKNGDAKHDQETNLKAERKLKAWMENTPLYLQLQWFDTVENVKVAKELREKRWTTEITARDRLYLDKLGVKHC